LTRDHDPLPLSENLFADAAELPCADPTDESFGLFEAEADDAVVDPGLALRIEGARRIGLLAEVREGG
jgi:hypothetical protein